MTNRKPHVVFFQRKARNVGNYSVEFIFEDIRNRLRDKIAATVAYSPYESSGLFKRLYNCVKAFRSQGDVNHITGDINYMGLLLNGKKTIHTILDCVFMAAQPGLKRSVLKYFWLTVPVKRSKFITAISVATKTEILKYVSCNPDKIVVIPVAISEHFVHKPKAFNKSKPVILQVGTAHNKNIPRLIEALDGLPCTLYIVGRQNEGYEKLLKQYNIDYSYQWGLTDEAMIAKYAEADIITLVSTYEGFGMPILEAQATGRPVITSNILSMPDVAGDAACLVDPENIASIRAGFVKIINDDTYRDSLVTKGLENIKRFDPDDIALQYLSLYQKTVLQ
ncbi:MAG: glycosyltransferase family 1 protein [Bacteroidota bacterium]